MTTVPDPWRHALRNGIVMWVVTAGLVAAAVAIWPGSPPAGEGMGGRHFIAFLATLTATFTFLYGAVYLVIATVRSAWTVERFRPSQYLSRLRQRPPG